ncbi:MAG: T9SS type A sorting domain-containing protein [Flavobacteriales bacterium]|nr:T9SS type A sorting domain-containing protein [Flavobacteriales bacterium]
MPRFLPALLFVSLTGSAFSQGLVNIIDEDGHTVNGTVIHHPCNFSTDTVSLLARLNVGDSRTVNVRRYEMWPVPGTNNFFCWGVCYLPVSVGTFSSWVSDHYVDMNPGATYNNFHAYHQAQGNLSTMRYKFVWYDIANPTGPDSSWVDIDFCGLVGVGERGSQQASLNVWPSPTDGRELQFDFAVEGSAPARVVLYDMLGAAIRRSGAIVAQGRFSWTTSGLEPGVYFATLERDGKAIRTRRVVVTQ